MPLNEKESVGTDWHGFVGCDLIVLLAGEINFDNNICNDTSVSYEYLNFIRRPFLSANFFINSAYRNVHYDGICQPGYRCWFK